jgi:hypothetical protein
MAPPANQMLVRPRDIISRIIITAATTSHITNHIFIGYASSHSFLHNGTA